MASAAPSDGAKNAAAAHLQSLFNSGKHSDVAVFCKVKRFDVHETVIAACPFFAGALAHEFKEKDSRVIEMDEDDPIAIEMLLRHLYAFEYAEVIVTLRQHVVTFATAQKYHLATLAHDAFHETEAMLSSYQLEENDTEIFATLVMLFEHMKEDYNLNKALMAFLQSNSECLFGKSYQKALLETFAECPEFARDLAIAGMTATAAAKFLTCSECDFEQDSREFFYRYSEGWCASCFNQARKTWREDLARKFT